MIFLRCSDDRSIFAGGAEATSVCTTLAAYKSVTVWGLKSSCLHFLRSHPRCHCPRRGRRRTLGVNHSVCAPHLSESRCVLFDLQTQIITLEESVPVLPAFLPDTSQKVPRMGYWARAPLSRCLAALPPITRRDIPLHHRVINRCPLSTVFPDFRARRYRRIQLQR
jgi:hypothetical protein